VKQDVVVSEIDTNRKWTKEMCTAGGRWVLGAEELG
jgi:hypothetical protein